MALRPLDYAQVTERVRSHADLIDSEYRTDEEIKGYINDSFSDIFNEMINLKKGFFLKDTEPLEPVEKNRIYYPEDFYKLNSLIQLYGGADVNLPIRELSIDEAESLQSPYLYGGYLPSAFCFVQFSDHLRLYPQDSVSGLKFKLYYIHDIDLGTFPLREEVFRFCEWNTAYLLSVIAQNPNPELKQKAYELRTMIKNWFSTRNQGVRVIKDTAALYDY